MAEIFSNKPGLDAYARTFENCIPSKDDVTVSTGYLYCLYLAAERDLTKAIASLRGVLDVTPSDCSQPVLSSLIRRVVVKIKAFKSFPSQCPRAVQFLQSTSHIPRRKTTHVSQTATEDIPRSQVTIATPRSQVTIAAQTTPEVSHSLPDRKLHTDCNKCSHRRKVVHKLVADKKVYMVKLCIEKKKNLLLVSELKKENTKLKQEMKSLRKKMSKIDESQVQKLKDELRRTKHCLGQRKRKTKLRQLTLESIGTVALKHQVSEETLSKKDQELETKQDMLNGEFVFFLANISKFIINAMTG